MRTSRVFDEYVGEYDFGIVHVKVIHIYKINILYIEIFRKL